MKVKKFNKLQHEDFKDKVVLSELRVSLLILEYLKHHFARDVDPAELPSDEERELWKMIHREEFPEKY
jgi:hypothetical protein